MDNQPVPPKHIPYADGMRVLAVVFVIALHSSAQGVIQYDTISLENWWTGNIINSLSRWAVPLFIMLSGALLLAPAKQESWSSFYTKRAKRIFAPFIIWVSFYFFWTDYFYGEPVDKEFIQKALFDGLTYNHLYFLFIIMGLYVVTPLIRAFVHHQKRWIVWILCMGILFLATRNDIYAYIPLNAFTKFIPYMGFFIVGFLLQHMQLSKVYYGLVMLSFCTSTAVIILGTGQQVEVWGIEDYRAFQFYNHFHLAVIIQSCSIFIAFQYLLNHTSNSFLKTTFSTIAPVTFGIYLIHVMFLNLLQPYTQDLFNQFTMVGIGVEVLLTFSLSTLTCLLLARTRILRHAIGS